MRNACGYALITLLAGVFGWNASLPAQSRNGPGQFKTGTPSDYTLTLVNGTDNGTSKLISDYQLQLIADSGPVVLAIGNRVISVALTLRPAQSTGAKCFDGERCLVISRSLLDGVYTDIQWGMRIGQAVAAEAMGAKVGDAALSKIIRETVN